MTTKTDFHAIQELREKYTPKVRDIVSGEEAKTICEVLEIDKRNNVELQNIRDMVVMIRAPPTASAAHRACSRFGVFPMYSPFSVGDFAGW